MTMTKVSTARAPITPRGSFFPCYLMGHAIRTQQATGIMDELWATALALEADGGRVLWVTVELIGLDREFTDRIRARAAQQHQLPAEAVNISYVHTHSAPEYQDHSIFAQAGQGAVPGYMDYVEQQVNAAIDACFAGEWVPVQVFAKQLEIKGCYGNRNGLQKPEDKTFVALKFCAQDGSVVAGACSFACHSTVLGPQNLQVSSDLAGYVARAFLQQWGVYPIVMVGAAGDMSNRLYRQGNDKAELERVGQEMMSQVFASPAPEIELQLHRPVIETYRYQQTFAPDAAKKQQQYDIIKEKIEHAANFDEKKVYSSALRMAELRLTQQGPYELDLECRYVDLGDLRLFVMPAELFSRFGLRIKQALGAKCAVYWGYSNYSAGYLGNREDYGDSFETSASDITPGTTEHIVEQIEQFLAQRR